MPAQSQAQQQGRKDSGRAQRRAAEEQAIRRKQFFWLGGAVAVALLVALALILLNRPQAQDIGAPIVAAAPLPPAVPASGTIVGAQDAPVAIVEWGDYQCPGCGIFAREVAPRLIAEYVEPGLASFEFRDFSFLGEESFRAAEAAACAGDQGAYWPYHDTLYANQRGENQNAFSDVRLKEIAKILSLDVDAFNRCFDSGEKRAQIEQSAADARERGINSTPSLFIDGTRVEEWRNWETVKSALDAALAKE
jgi:protein-disulfide isomerase